MKKDTDERTTQKERKGKANEEVRFATYIKRTAISPNEEC